MAKYFRCCKKRNSERNLTRRELSSIRLEEFKKDVVSDAHLITIDHLCYRFDTNITTGLTKEKARDLLKKYGYNELTPSRKTPEYVKFLLTLVEGFSLLLWIGAILCGLSCFVEYFMRETIDTDNLTLGLVLVIIIILNGCFVYYQEHKSSKIMESFGNMIPLMASVIREGQNFNVQAKELVIGDLVMLKFGDRVPADVRILKNSGLKVDNSALTGESEPLPRSTEYSSINFHESRNVGLFSTNVVEGTATAVVVATGDDTVMGHIAGLTARLQPNQTPISRELKKFMHLVTIWACCIGTTLGVFCAVMGYSWIESALFLIGIIVSNVPEGLLATVTVSLSVTAKRLASKNCLVKNLPCVETLGSTSVICSDKTGTLTQNKMTVCHLWYNGNVTSADVSPAQEDSDEYKSEDGFKMLMRAATLCNRAAFDIDQQNTPIMQRTVAGDASEAAILKFVELTQCDGPVDAYKKKWPKLVEIPFNSTTKYQVSVHAEENLCIVVMKGAPEKVIERCDTIYLNNATTSLNPKLRAMCDQACMELADEGERVLGFADYTMEETYTSTYPFSVDPEPNFPMKGLRFVGFISMIDPPRPQVPEAVRKCRSAGIKIIMVTGDHPVTAKSIARDVGIITLPEVLELTDVRQLAPTEVDKAIVISGSTLRELTTVELQDILFNYKEIVFARTSPAQKLQIVEGCQTIDHIVAVTGDGVNDSPALKKADIGIAMGISGTEVSKQSADMILLDDNFASLIVGVEEGRKIFDNLKKSIAYTLASNIPEVTPFLAFIICGIPLPIGVLAVLCIDVLTDMLPAISLAYEEAESDIMQRPPRNPSRDHLVTEKLYFFAYGHIGFIEAAAGFFVYFMIMAEYGFLPRRLIGLRKEWDSMLINDLQDSYGQEWTYEERKILQYTCYTAFLIAIVITQWADAIICKTRWNSLFTQGMKNWQLHISIFIETVIACILAYYPGSSYLKFYPVKFRWWLYAMPFGVAMFIFDEFRKWHIRRYPKGYWARETFY